MPAKHTPPTMQVAFVFNPSCGECRRLILSMSSQALSEARVTRWTVTKGASHLHEVADEPPAAKPPLAPPTDTLFDMPQSDTNGFDPPNRE